MIFIGGLGLGAQESKAAMAGNMLGAVHSVLLKSHGLAPRLAPSLSDDADHMHVVAICLFVSLLCACIVLGHLLEENRWMSESITALLLVSNIYISHVTLVVLHNYIGELICNSSPCILCIVFLFAVVSNGYFHYRLDCFGIHILLYRVSIEPFFSTHCFVCMCAGALYWNRCFDFKQGSKFPCTQI